MSLVRKYDKTLRRRVALRAVWLPGTAVKPGDIMLLKDGALQSVGNLDNNAEITFKAKGEIIQNILANGLSAGVSKQSDLSMNLEVMGKSGPVVMQVFRVKRNGDIF